jgi:hypothetical protein
VFDTVSNKWVEADIASFACDKPSGYYLSPKYYFDARTGWYRTMPASGVAPAGTLTAPLVIHTILGDVVVGSPDYNTAVALGIIGPDGQAVSTAGTGAGSTNQGAIANSGQTWFDMTNLVNVINVLQSTANSGTVAADSNTTAGDVSSGTVSVVANLINLLASAWSWSHGNLNFFMQNLFGNQTGDIMLQPNAATTGGGGLGSQSVSNAQTGPGSTNAGTINNANALNVDAQAAGNITNNVNLAASSGNANAADNTSVGNVSTGSAAAQVNIINLINSFISSGSSFFGILNIFGNLNGDILFPAGFLNGLLGTTPTAGTNSVATNGTGASSTNLGTINNSQATNLTGSSTQNFNNNVNTAAQSGSANVTGNTSTGNVSTGASTTSGSLFNIANSSIFGDNAVLVMVNVLGHWMGRIMSIPGGGSSQAALLTGNATVTQNSTGPASTNTGTINNAGTANINMASSGTITNNVNVAAQSGNANVTDNTKVGAIATGTAQATSSVANLMNTALNVTHWFGVLIINVFGSWIGSVNVNTSAGDATAVAAASSQIQAPTPTVLAAVVHTFSAPLVQTSSFSPVTVAPSVAPILASGAAGQVLTAASHIPASDTTLASHNSDMTWLFMISALLLLLAGAVFQIEAKLRHH